MIYKLLVKNNEGKHKEIYLTEDSKNKVIKRACSTYALSPQDITVLVEYKETKDGYELSQEFVKEGSKKDKKIAELASQMYKQAPARCEPYKTQYREKYSMTEFTITSEDDIIELLNKYKRVKVYWETTEKRGEHSYYALCK